jgi:hypothetical protein
MNSRPLRFFTALLLLPAVSRAQPAPAPAAPQPATKPAEFVLHPSPFPSPSIQYRLLPDVVDLERANAAPLYLLGCSKQFLAAENQEMQKEVDALEAATPEAMDHNAVKKILATFNSSLREVELGARREYCHWELPTRSEGFSTLLPHLTDLRFLARLLSLQAKLQIAEHDFDHAAHTLQTSFGLAHHLNQDAFLIQMLVGGAISDMALKRVEQWITTPGSPNLYWSLTDLPAPFLDIRAGMLGERALVYSAIPHLKEAVAGKLTPEHFQEMLHQLNDLGILMQGSAREENGVVAALQAAATAATALPQAKAALREMGYNAADLDAMQPGQLIGLWWGQSYERTNSEMSKSLALPFYQDLTIEAASKASQDIKPTNILQTLQPALYSARLSMNRIDRHVGELRCLEALRGYAAAHDGKAPANLADITGIPLPIDPATGKIYTYQVDQDGALLDLPMPRGAKDRHGWQDRITLKK